MAANQPRLSEMERRVKNWSPVIAFRNDTDRSDLCSKPPDLRSLGDIALNLSLHKSKRE